MGRLEDVLQGRAANYMLPFFWQHGEEEATLREYMGAIYDANIREVCVESRPHPDFAGEKWWQDMEVILDEAKKRGMRVWILDDSHFPTGYANGAVNSAPRELKHRYMCCRTLEMSGPVRQAEFPVKQYMQPAPPPPWIPAPPPSEDDFSDDELVKVFACEVLPGEELGAPIDLTDQIEDGLVSFDLPEGYFQIFVIYLTRNAKGRNDYINFLDEESCRILIDAVYEPHYEHFKDYFGNVIAGFFSDEPPIGNVEGYMPIGPIGTKGQNLPWSRAAKERLTKEYGSTEWENYLPYLWATAKDKGQQAKVRSAYMDMVSGLVAECFSAQNGKWCEEHGVEYIGHQLEDCDMNTNMGASMGHFFRGLSGQHMAGIDNIGGQVTINGQNVSRHPQPACADEAGFYQYLIGKLGASHAAIDPKKQGRCLCENFGAYGWQSGPKEQKFMMDHFMARGVNRYVPHAFSPAPFPDPDCPPHFYAHGENPTYRAFGELMAYSNRVCHLIDGGRACPDVALLYNAESVWAGDATSNIRAARYLAQAQIDFHVIPADVFMEDRGYPTDFDNGMLTVNGVAYRALVISGCDYLEPHVADFVEKAHAKGFTVVFADRRPVGVIGADAQENRKFAEWTDKVDMVSAEDIGAYFQNLSQDRTTGDAQAFALQTVIAPANEFVTSYHYTNGQDVYLLLNEMSARVYSGIVTLQGTGVPVRYAPWENRVTRVAYERRGSSTVELHLDIQPLELCVIVFAADETEAEALCPEKVRKYEVQGSEITEFSVGRVDSREYLDMLKAAGADIHGDRAVATPKETWQLQAPFTGMQKQYPDFSGYYIYEAKTELKAGVGYQLIVEDAGECVEAFLNGQSLGTRVQTPFVFEIPAQLKSAESTLRIEVATLAERKARAAGAMIAAMSQDRPLSPTGIVGTVRLHREIQD